MTTSIYIQDYKAIEKLLFEQYGEGGKQAKSTLMAPAFNKNATMYGIDGNGKLIGGPVTESLYPTIDNSFIPSPKAQSVIAYIDIQGTAASARVDTNNISGFCFTDYFNLLKEHDKWKIINKIYHTNSAE